MNPRRHQTPKTNTTAKRSVSLFRRVSALQIAMFVMASVLIGRLFYLQVIKHDHYDNLAKQEHQRKYAIPATRGTLYFRDGDNVSPAVLNSTVYTLYADPKEVKDAESSAKLIQAALTLDYADTLKKLKTPDTSYVILKKRLSKEQVTTLFENKAKLVGINVTPVPQRVYPEGELAAQALGFVNDEGKGQYGVEEALNNRLGGTPGERRAITDVHGVPLSLDTTSNVQVAPKNGQDLVLTIDRNIQSKAEEILANGLKKYGATKGSLLVMDPNTGAVRAMANMPTYDPSKYYEVTDDAYEKFRNKIVSDPYEVGSVLKTLTMATGINEGVVNKDSRYYNTDSVRIDDTTIRNASKVPGSRSMTEVLQFSLNTGVVYVAQQLGGGQINLQSRQKIYDYFTNRYGLGSLTGIEQAGEATGKIYKPTDEQGNNVRYSNMVFGQGMNVSMIQVASAFSATINGGNYYQPHVIEGSRSSDGTLANDPPKPARQGVVTADTSAQLREMTRIALNESAAVAGVVKKGYNVGGKTGTSQIIDPKTGKYIDTNAIGTYLGFGGDAQKARYVVMVKADDAKTAGGDFAGSKVAAPIFGDMSNWLLDYYNVAPL